MNYFTDSGEWRWLVKNAFDWKKITKYSQDDFTLNEIESALEMVGKWSGAELAARAGLLDKEGAGTIENGKTVPGPLLSQTLSEARELGLFGLSAPTSFGGSGLPFSITILSFGLMARGCMATTCQLTFFNAIIDMFERYTSLELQQKFIPQIINGEISGSMGLTEPEAGSDLGNLKTKAVLQADGSYRLTGSKCFITNGGGGLGFTLARIEGAPAGVEGISLFLVEQEIDENGKKIANYKITKKEDKLGLSGTFTCEVVYENTKALLLGKAHEGFSYMLHLMNQSRIGVGVQAVAGMEASLGFMAEYAQTRVAFGKPIAQLPLYAHNLKQMEVERDAIRALVFDTLSHYDVYRVLSLKTAKGMELNTEEQEDYRASLKIVRKRTPLVKYYSSETNVTITAKVMQGLGSYGYSKEYPVERFHRESFGPLMYEGTSQIQALMALKDTLKELVKNPTSAMKSMLMPASLKLNFDQDSLKQCQTLENGFQKNLTGLLFKTVSGDLLSVLKKMIKGENLLNDEAIEKLMIHAESITQGLSYLETLKVLAHHANINSERLSLFQDYHKLVLPRLIGIYAIWDQV